MKKTFAATLMLVCCSIGCEASSKSESISIKDVPENILTTAQEKLPDVTFDQAVRKSNGILEVRGKDKKGKVRDVEFNKSGEVVEIE